MPRIDPLKLLTCLKVLLASNGGIRSENEVKRLAGLMTKYSKKLVSKCIYIQILKCTNTELLGEFMGAGGWSLTHMWLSDGIHAMNWPLVQEILELLLLCPVDVQRLRSNTAPKLVKGLCQNGGNEGVRILATKLVEQWLKVVKGETMAPNYTPTNNHSITPTSTEVTEENASRVSVESNKSTDGVPKSSITDSSNTALAEPPQIPVAEVTATEEDPLAIPSSKADPINNQIPQSPPVAQKASNENALVYQIVVKDGKQVLAKIENSTTGEKTEKSNLTESESKKDNRQSEEEEKAKDVSNKENEKRKEKESENKEEKESSKDKEKSRSSKDKHREHKSSSHKSSSSKSSKSGSSSSKSRSSSSHRSSSDNKNRDKDSDRDSEKEKDKHKSSTSRSSSSSSTSSKDKHRDKERSSKDKEKHKEKEREKEKDKEKEKEREKVEQTEKDKDTLSKVTPPSIDKLGKIPKKPKDDTEKPAPTSITIPSKKASMSIEIRKDTDRPKTVKTYKSQFRSHGLSEEAPPPPSRKGLKKPPSHSIPGTSIPSSLSLNLNLKRPSPPPQPAPVSSTPAAATPASKELAPPVEKKIKFDLTSTSNSTSEKPGAIKLIAPKPKHMSGTYGCLLLLVFWSVYFG